MAHGLEEDDSVATLTLLTEQFGQAVGADGTALMLRTSGGDDGTLSVLGLGGDCAGPAAPEMPTSDDDLAALASQDGGPHWILRRFPVSRDGATYLLLGAMFRRARSGSTRVVAEAEQRFQPLFAGFARLWGRDRASERRLAGYASALNHSDMGVILLDREADILFANDVATALLDSSNGIRRRRQSIGATDLSDAVKLQIAIDHVITAEADRTSRAPIISLKRGIGKRPLILSVLAPKVASAGARDVAAILYICDPEQDLMPLMHAACRFYRLSPVETRLASTLASGATLTEAAEALHIKEQTARSYLKQVFIKTGTRRQGELIRVMLTSISRAAPKADFDII
ncbi:DNA-binding CsgD family transcriptional regulator/PAS domain-containing protein [Sphingomonas jejuensis]|uniref:DNA-binding CsgD family transcriptional regulator/PAS domain-containing protein n=1 Tax=Sphingomonas jejuensis TaxID=904715 RepID=A0ABX0XJE8_9SPHN|nr:hypothetical protein [Sphingomonas jejuensis]NJC32926.1 DNA-binding CsgD family transcriptional regulator/PAS domain-containing protein [Sphingomonas jejuensis]